MPNRLTSIFNELINIEMYQLKRKKLILLKSCPRYTIEGTVNFSCEQYASIMHNCYHTDGLGLSITK